MTGLPGHPVIPVPPFKWYQKLPTVMECEFQYKKEFVQSIVVKSFYPSRSWKHCIHQSSIMSQSQNILVQLCGTKTQANLHIGFFDKYKAINLITRFAWSHFLQYAPADKRSSSSFKGPLSDTIYWHLVGNCIFA